ncbi:MAG: hypothetical protein JO006_12175 [Paucibacter sp.]|nr:hypothetical protein [Roseateles sp.]
MHLLIPHASALGEEATQTLAGLTLPNLSHLLGAWQARERHGSDEFSPDLPHEAALAALRGEAPAVAAWRAAELGLPGERPWALLTPLHLAVSLDQVTAHAAELSEADSQLLFEDLAELWPAAEGWSAHWAGPAEWLVSHDSLAGVASASIDRVVQRNIAPWLPEARRLRSLQNEVQMLLHRHPLNEIRAAPVNSVWISGCGASTKALPAEVRVDWRLRAPLLAGDWQAWAAAWQALDAELLALAPASLTLCGERFAQVFGPGAAGGLVQRLWQRVAPPRADVASLLATL